VTHFTRLEILDKSKHSNLSSPLISYKENIDYCEYESQGSWFNQKQFARVLLSHTEELTVLVIALHSHCVPHGETDRNVENVVSNLRYYFTGEASQHTSSRIGISSATFNL
jgi:hypothetical protein